MADAAKDVRESFDRLHKVTTFALTTLLVIGYVVLHGDATFVIENVTIDVQFAGIVVFLLLSCVNFYIAAVLQSARVTLLVAERNDAQARIDRGETVEVPLPSDRWSDPKVFLNTRPTLVEELREEYRKHPWLCNPYSETGPGAGRVTDCLGILILCILWSLGGWMGRHHRTPLIIPAPVRLNMPDPLIQRMRAQRAPHAVRQQQLSAAARKSESIDLPIAAPKFDERFEPSIIAATAVQEIHLVSFYLVLLLLLTSLHEVAISRTLLRIKIALTVAGGLTAIAIGGFSTASLGDPAQPEVRPPAINAPRTAPTVVVVQPPTKPVPVTPEEMLIAAIKRNDQNTFPQVTQWLAQGVSPQTTDDDGTPAIVLAAERGESDVVTKLLADRRTVAQRDPKGRSALVAAAEQDNHALAGQLAKVFVDASQYDEIARAIVMALDRNDAALLAAVRVLPKQLSTPTALVQQATARLSLHDQGIPFDAQWLVHYISRKMTGGETRSTDIVKLFGQGGMPLTMRDENGSNLLMLAYRWHNDSLAAVLANRPGLCEAADINRFGETAKRTHDLYCPECKAPSCGR